MCLILGAWWYTLGIPVLGRIASLRPGCNYVASSRPQLRSEFQTNLSYIARPYLKKKRESKTNKKPQIGLRAQFKS
jgi:hypothetical protein